jgi:glutamine cyclotransferase
MKPVFQTMERLALMAVSTLTLAGCPHHDSHATSIPPDPASATEVAHYTPQVVHTWPHDADAFTEGLFFRNGDLFESTGLNGHSNVRESRLTDGKVLKEIVVPSAYFGEGIVAIGSKLYQVTWKTETGFIYDADTFARLGEFKYSGEGWGLTTDGKLLILSDGTSHLRFLDPANFSVVRTIDVRENGQEVTRLNELEYVRGDILANIWQTDRIVRIDAATGQVKGEIDCSGLLSPADRTPRTDVLNGIAYDETNDRLILTGKFWPKVFEVRLVPATTNGVTAPAKAD